MSDADRYDLVNLRCTALRLWSKLHWKRASEKVDLSEFECAADVLLLEMLGRIRRMERRQHHEPCPVF